MTKKNLKENIKFKKIFEIIEEAIAITTIDINQNISKIIEVNSATVKIFGYTKKELLNKHILDFHAENIKKDKTEIIHQRKETLFKEKKISFEMTSKHKNGNKLILKVKTILVEGTHPYLIHIIKDITEKKQVEGDLKESREKFKMIFENAPVATWHKDYTLVFKYFDELKEKKIKNLEVFLNKNPKELIKFTKLVKVIDLNKAALDLYEAETKKELLSTTNKVFIKSLFKTFKKGLINLWNGNETGEFYSTIETFKNNQKDVIINYKKLPIKNNKIHYLLTLRDITEKNKIEEARTRNHSLNALGEMASSVAHDFNNSLQTILGNLELIIYDQNNSDKNFKILKTIKQATLDAAERVKIVRRFKKKKENNNYSLLNIENLINDVIIQSRPIWKDEAEKKGILINITKSYNKVPKVLGDRGELRSVIYNILKNSIEAMPKGGEIIFTTSKTDNNIEILVKDTGTGMSNKIKNKVFQPFYTTKGFELGRGLGMSGSYSIIKEHKGNIEILDTSNKGTSIKITIPIPTNEEKTKITKRDNFSTNQKPKKTRKLNILWVDDEEMIRDIAKKYINLMGHTGKTAKDGIEALSLLKENPYDLLITDIGMPNMNGWQLIKKIKEDFSKEIKIIVVTGWGSNVKDDSTPKSHYASLQKPIQIKDLRKILDSI